MRAISQVGSSLVRQSMTVRASETGTSGSRNSSDQSQPTALPIRPPLTRAASTHFHSRPGRSAIAKYVSLGSSSGCDAPSNRGACPSAPGAAPDSSAWSASSGSSGSGSGTRSMIRGTSTPDAAATNAPNAAASRFAAQSMTPDPSDLRELRVAVRASCALVYAPSCALGTAELCLRYARVAPRVRHFASTGSAQVRISPQVPMPRQ